MTTARRVERLGSLCEVIAGQSPEGKFYNTEGKGLPFYQGKKDFGEKFIEEPTTWTTQTTKTAVHGDILMSVRAPVGPVNFANDRICIGRGLAAIRAGKELNRDFLYYQLLHQEPTIAGTAGAVFNSINKSQIEALPIVTVPTTEQTRIVGILDEAFEGIASAKANAEQNRQSAHHLFETQLTYLLTQRGEGWEDSSLVSVCSTFIDSAHRTPTYQPDGIPALRPRDVVNGILNLAEAARVSHEEYEIQSKRYKPQKGDIVYSRELSFGWAAVVPPAPRVCLSQGMCVFTPSEKFNARLLVYLLNSPIVRDQAIAAAVGAAHPHINLGDIKAYRLPVPPMSEQAGIVAQLDALWGHSRVLESTYRKKTQALDDLQKSFLQAAFTGQL